MSSRPFVPPGQQPPTAPPRFPSKPPVNKPPRRGFLGAAAAMMALPAGAAAAQPTIPDAALLAACAAYMVAAAEQARRVGPMDAAPDGPEYDAAADAWDAACGVADVALDRVLSIQAVTLAGAAAKGRSVATYWRTLRCPGEPARDAEELAAQSVLDDLERLAGGAA